MVRLDAWISAVRLYKSRSVATSACRGGHVAVNGQKARASSLVRIGDRVTALTPGGERVVVVRRLIAKRVGGPVAVTCYEDHTPPPPPKEVASGGRDVSRPVQAGTAAAGAVPAGPALTGRSRGPAEGRGLGGEPGCSVGERRDPRSQVGSRRRVLGSSGPWVTTSAAILAVEATLPMFDAISVNRSPPQSRSGNRLGGGRLLLDGTGDGDLVVVDLVDDVGVSRSR